MCVNPCVSARVCVPVCVNPCVCLCAFDHGFCKCLAPAPGEGGVGLSASEPVCVCGNPCVRQGILHVVSLMDEYVSMVFAKSPHMGVSVTDHTGMEYWSPESRCRHADFVHEVGVTPPFPHTHRADWDVPATSPGAS